MINTINTSIPRTNDALSKQQRQDQRRKRKKTRDESEDSHDTPLNEEEEHLELFACSYSGQYHLLPAPDYVGCR